MTTHASGTFEVKLNPQDDKSDETTLGRMTIDKQFHGDLEGSSKGQMLTAGTAVKGKLALRCAFALLRGDIRVDRL